MSYLSLMNHRARVWRPLESRGHAFREVIKDYEVVHEPTRNNCRPPSIRWAAEELSAGEASKAEGDRRWFLTADVDVQRFDVIELLSGPEAGRRLRVLDASYPHSHSKRVRVEPWFDHLPTDEES